MEQLERNSVMQIRRKAENASVTWGWPLFAVFMRTLLFYGIGFVIVGTFSLSGEANPMKAAVPWWPFQVIFSNIICILVLSHLAKKEGMRFVDYFNLGKERFRSTLLLTLLYIFVGFAVGAGGLYGSAYLIFGTGPSDVMFQALPFWAAMLILIALPITNGLVETTTYMAYALPRIEALSGKQSLAIILAAFGLSLQHVAIPLIFDGKFMLWRIVSFIPLALVLGTMYVRNRRMLPIVISHGIMDFQLVISIFLASI